MMLTAPTDRWARDKETPSNMVELARRRTRFLFSVLRSAPETRVSDLLASAYMQGMRDAVDVLCASLNQEEEGAK